MSHAENVARLQAVLGSNQRTVSNLFLNHDEQILSVVTADGSNPVVHFTLFWIIRFVFKLIMTCCCHLFFWNRGHESVKIVLVLTNQRLIKFKESQGSKNGDFPKRCATSRIASRRVAKRLLYLLRVTCPFCFEAALCPPLHQSLSYVPSVTAR
jgi:hypothetical protein